MKINHRTLVLLFILPVFCSIHSYGQDKLFTLEKNRNVLANDLVHTLNRTKDSLLLRSNQKIHYIYSINRENEKEINQFVDAHEALIPLNDLSSGKHVIAVSLEQKKILFVVWVHDPNESYIARKPKRTEVVSGFN